MSALSASLGRLGARLNSADLPRRVAEVLLVLAVATLATWWALRLLTGAPLPVAPPAASAPRDPAAVNDGLLDTAPLFGSRRPGTLSDNIQAIGLIAGARGTGSALLSVDGQPPKRYKVGEEVDGRRIVAIRPGAVEIEAQGVRRVIPLNLPEAQGGVVVRR